MMNRVILVGTVEGVGENTILLNVEEQRMPIRVWAGIASKIPEFVGLLVGVQGKLTDTGVVAEKISVVKEVNGKEGEDERNVTGPDA